MSDRRLTTRQATGLTGLGVAVLFGVGSALWALEQPSAGAPATEVLAFYTDTAAWIVAGAGLSLLAIALFVFFASGIRAILREHEGDDFLATAAARFSRWRLDLAPRPSTWSARYVPTTVNSRQS